MNETEVARQVYDLLGYGALTAEVIEYLKEKLFASVSSVDDLVPLFQRLKQFYDDWCQGTFIDSAPSENWPQIKMMQVRAAEIETGVRQVDIHAGMNVLLLLFVVHEYGQQQTEESEKSLLHFHPCEDADSKTIDKKRLRRIIEYSQLVRLSYFASVVGQYLSRADLCSVDLSRAHLSRASLSYADLSYADLSYADLSYADLSYADLSRVNLSYANLSYANLSYADLSRANLSYTDFSCADLSYTDFNRAELSYSEYLGGGVRFNENTNWKSVYGLEAAVNLPDALRQRLWMS